MWEEITGLVVGLVSVFIRPAGRLIMSITVLF
jgi:hypothetical protein